MRPTYYWLAQLDAARRVGSTSLKNAFVHKSGAKPTSTGGPLQDWSISVKNNICTLDMPTSCSSNMLLDYVSPFEATAVQLLRQSGANVVAKTNCDEFGMGSSNLFSVHGPVINPESQIGQERVAGGSSGGAAAGVACGASRIALASDTGGSIRTPAAYCGVYGLKPSYGLISRWGLVAYADSLDTVGLIGSQVQDIRTSFKTISQYDIKDPTSVTTKLRHRSKEESNRTMERISVDNGPLSGLRVGVPQEFFPVELHTDMIPPLRNCLARLKTMGAELISVKLPSIPFALSAYYVLASAEASSNLAKYDGIRYGHRNNPDPPVSPPKKPSMRYLSTPLVSRRSPLVFLEHISKTRSEGFGKEVQKRILLGTYCLTSDLFDNYFLQAQRVRSMIRQDFDRVFRVANVLIQSQEETSNGVDILITPSTVNIAPTLQEAAKMGIEAYTQDLLTVPASLAGLPAMSIPAGRVRGMPVGVTLTSQWGCEEVVFKVASTLATA